MPARRRHFSFCGPGCGRREQAPLHRLRERRTLPIQRNRPAPMGKSRDFRGPRRRGFDDDAFFPGGGGGGGGGYDANRPRPFGGGGFSRPAPVVEGPVVEATVKWFNPEKGFGFVALADGSGDAFLHVGVLQASGHDAVAPGATLQVQVGQGPKGPQITRVAEIDESTATAPARSAPKGPRSAPDPASATELTGT